MRRWTWAALWFVLGACDDDPDEVGSPDDAAEPDDADSSDQDADDEAEEEDDEEDDDPTDVDEQDDLDDGQECDPLDTDAVLSGSVFSPNLQIPISGAVVYLTRGALDPIVDGTYCAECVKLGCDEPYTLTRADGSFELNAVAGEGQQLVVQKGEFRRVVAIDVMAGTQEVAKEETNLPGRWDPDAGMWIPRIAVYQTQPDAVFNVLAKFGLAEVDAAGWYVPGSEQFTLVPDFDATFLESFEEMSKHHIIFVPCAATKFWPGAPIVPTTRIENVRDYVAAGGKWYATDHSNEYIAEPFPAYQDFYSSSAAGGEGIDIQPAYSSTGTVVDEGLLAWLEALPDSVKNSAGVGAEFEDLPAVTTHLNYSGIDAIHEVLVEQDGEQVNVGHHAFVEGPCSSCSEPQRVRPMAVSGQYGCGRMMFSTFETSSTPHVGMTPQELVLLYMILEISVCHEEEPPPPPPD